MNFHYDGTKWVYNHYNTSPNTIDNAAINIYGTYMDFGLDYSNFHLGNFWYGKPIVDVNRTIQSF